MEDRKDYEEEQKYLDNTLKFIRDQCNVAMKTLISRKKNLLETRKEMWEETVHFCDDFERLTEISQYLEILKNHTTGYESIYKAIQKYKAMLKEPYFGRFDFVEEGINIREKIYIGLYSAMDIDNLDIRVYDWRSPVASIFYKYELGEASYQSLDKMVKGNALLKRQYKIKNGHLKYFFNCNVTIHDEMLKEVLSQHTTAKMKNIVKSIQKEQNEIIRDKVHDLLMIQGVAGSGKTSVALHRIAFLLYEGMGAKLTSNNILILSPNTIFSRYISKVLPELGEDQVKEMTFYDLATCMNKEKLKIENKFEQLECLVGSVSESQINIRKQSIYFKGSKTFVRILKRWIKYYIKYRIQFQDVYYHGITIATKQSLKNEFFHDPIGRLPAKRLKKMENILFSKIHPYQKKRLKKIQLWVQTLDGHELEVQSFSRLISMKQSKVVSKKIKKFTYIDIVRMYQTLFEDDSLFLKLCRGLNMPPNILKIVKWMRENFNSHCIFYEDCAPLMFLHLKIEGNDYFHQIKHIVMDEAQDYSFMEYEVLKLLFDKRKFTIFSDTKQCIDKDVDESMYDEIIKILDRKNYKKLFLNKSYRSSYEISTFAQKILKDQKGMKSFKRHDKIPSVVNQMDRESLENDIEESVIKYLKKEYYSIAIVCKTATEAKKVHERLKEAIDIQLIDSNTYEIKDGVVVIPAYMMKGLEFDVVMVYDASYEKYKNDLDQKLLYIICTRALHRLRIYYIGKKSKWLP